ncbi:MAG: hypothetical protein HFF57_09320 [Lawsonibacter sp.]|jgi:hypothetical protein|nr:hypothetical protein [Lawsonibacter sp.]
MALECYVSLYGNNVVGPDEYKEHVDNNAFTNYLVWWTIDKAIEYSELLQKEKPELYAKLDEKLGLSALREKWVERSQSQADILNLGADTCLEKPLDLKEVLAVINAVICWADRLARPKPLQSAPPIEHV